MSQADVIVVGAGPGGSSAAYFLARAGAKVVLLDKEKFPRHKVCGDGISPRSLAQLARMGLSSWLEGKGFHAPRGVRIGAPGGEIAAVGIPCRGERDYCFGMVVPRRQLDAALAQAAAEAGARFMDSTRATGMSLEDGARVHVETNGKSKSLRCRIVVVADGAQGSFGRSIGLRSGPLLCVAARTYVAGEDRQEQFVDMLFDPDIIPCYGWVFPVGEGVCNVGIGMLVEHARRRGLVSRLQEFLSTNPHVLERLPRWETVSRSRGFGLYAGFSPRRVYRDRLLVVGDAAGLVSPLTGSGISRALISGEAAARHAAPALTTGDCSARSLAGYGRELRARFGKQHALLRIVRRLVGHGRVLDRIVYLLNHDEEFRRLAQDILEDKADYAHLLRPGVLIKLLDFN